jgi:hypothetical protein
VVILPSGTIATTDEDGLFGLYLHSGPLLLRVKALGYKTQLVEPGAMPLGGRVEVDVEMQTFPTTTLDGTVRRSDTSAGIPGAVIRIPGTALATSTGPDGTYSFPEVAIGQKILTAESFGFASQEGRVVLAAGQGAMLDLWMEPGRFVDDAEIDQGWMPRTGDGEPDQGDWERVDPNGTGGGAVQPEDDHTVDPGAMAYITGQSAPGASVHDNDVEGGVARLTSPAIDISGLGAARLRYYRWFSNSAGVFESGSFTAEVSPDGVSYVPVETVQSEANSWTRREFDIGSVVPLSGEVHVRLLATAGPFGPGLQVLECGVDDLDIVSGCLARFSPGANDADGDGTVDACDACPLDVANDADADGFCGDSDNTPFTSSADQADADGDGVGDAADNCAGTINPDQRDLDRDGTGDSCDADADGDGLEDSIDTDDDNDGTDDGDDVCPNVPDGAQLDLDDDGTGDSCDADDGIVRGVRLAAGDLIVWEPENGSDSYNLYRGELGAEILQPLATCRANSIGTRYYIDPDLPLPGGDGFFYLITRIAAGIEDSLGWKSNGEERFVNTPCP